MERGRASSSTKVRAAVDNARAFLAVQEEHGSFAAYAWRFVGGGTPGSTHGGR